MSHYFELLEPAAEKALSPEHAALVSAAISLKRIADVMEKGSAFTFDVDSQFGQLTNLAWEMGRSFRGGTGQ